MGPLRGIRVVEMVGLGPAPYATRLLSDLGADVVRVDRLVAKPPSAADPVNRDRPCVRADLKQPAGTEAVLRLIDSADAVVEPFRPGVMERLGLSPAVCLHRNRRLVYLRMTGWGQTGPLASSAGHDINYIAVSGILHELRRSGDRPLPPLNLLGDYAGGSLFLVIGLLAGVLDARASGAGQVVDVSILDGVASLLTGQAAWQRIGAWDATPGSNLLQTAAPFYDVYVTSDDRYLAVGAIEPKFYREFVSGLGLETEDLPRQYDRQSWPAVKQRFADVIRKHTRTHWEAVFAGTDACVSPVLSPEEAANYPHVKEREVFVERDGAHWPAPAPRFSRTVAGAGHEVDGIDYTHQALSLAGFTDTEIDELIATATIG